MNELAVPSQLSEQAVTITMSDETVKLSCLSRKDAEMLFEWLCALCAIKSLPNA